MVLTQAITAPTSNSWQRQRPIWYNPHAPLGWPYMVLSQAGPEWKGRGLMNHELLNSRSVADLGQRGTSVLPLWLSTRILKKTAELDTNSATYVTQDPWVGYLCYVSVSLPIKWR